MTTRAFVQPRRLLPALVLACLCLGASAQAATITIVNNDGVGEGFNDPTPAAPVGGNPGTTVGQQRLNVFQQAASVWGAILPSDVEIRVNAQFNPLSCTATSGVLGSCGATSIFRDFPNAPFTGTWYTKAEANKLAGYDLNPSSADISAQFNSNLGTTGCLETSSWYYGFDHNEGASGIDLLAVVIHELTHGLGFICFVNLSTGQQYSNYPDVYERFLLDNGTGLRWTDETNPQRAASAINTYNLFWDGDVTKVMAPLTLNHRPVLTLNAPVTGVMNVGTASFGPALSYPGVTGNVVLADDGAAPTSDACTALVNGGAMAGNIALVDRGTCAFTIKVKNAQNAGAIAVIVADNVASSQPAGMSGTDPTITIPSVRVTKVDGDSLKARIARGLNVTLRVDPDLLAGADAQGRMIMYSPNPVESGSSVSHWDPMASPNLSMEPFINSDLTSSVDLSRYLFMDIGWMPPATGVPPADRPATALLRGNTPNPFGHSTSIRFELSREGAAELAIYDLSGRLIKRLVNGVLPAGSHVMVWDGTDDSGRQVPSGAYFSRLKVGESVGARTLVMVH